MKKRFLTSCRWILLLAVLFPLYSCGGDELSDSRIRLIRQSPFLFVPPSASQLVSIDINRIRQLSIYKDFLRAFLEDPGRLSVWNELSRRQGGDDPLSQIDLAVFAGYAPKPRRPMNETLVVLTGKWTDNEKFLEGIRMLSAEGFLDNPPEFTPFGEGGMANAYSLSATSTLHPGETVSIYVSFPGPGICVFSLSKERFTKCNGAIFETLPAITDDEGWSYHFGRVRLDQPVWAAGWIPVFEWREFMEDQVQNTPELKDLWNLVHNHPVTFYGYLETENRYMLNFEMLCENERAAELFEFDLNKARRVIPRMLNNWFSGDARKIDEWKAIFDEIEVTRQAESIFFNLELVEEEATRLIEVTTAEVEVTPTPKPVPDPFRRRD